jgi:hypothetical protein
VPRIVANLIRDREQDLELWIRPDWAGYGYMVEWTTLDCDHGECQSRRGAVYRASEGQDSFRDRARQLLSRITPKFAERMPTFEVDQTTINVFAVGGTYLFKHYFEQDEVFDALRPYYKEDDYRFEVPQDAFKEVRETLEDHFFEPVVIRDLEPFCVVYPKYAEHPDVLFKASVLQRSHRDHHVFLMKDQLSVEQAVNNGATELAESEVDVALDDR